MILEKGNPQHPEDVIPCYFLQSLSTLLRFVASGNGSGLPAAHSWPPHVDRELCANCATTMYLQQYPEQDPPRLWSVRYHVQRKIAEAFKHPTTRLPFLLDPQQGLPWQQRCFHRLQWVTVPWLFESKSKKKAWGRPFRPSSLEVGLSSFPLLLVATLPMPIHETESSYLVQCFFNSLKFYID